MSYRMIVAPRVMLAAVGAALAVVAACSDNQEPTSPAPKVSSPALSSAAAEVADGGRASAKPTDQVGFTKVIPAQSAVFSVLAGSDASGSVLCPVGSTATGGGFFIANSAGTFASVKHSRLITIDNQNGWSVAVSNKAAGAASTTFQVYVLCIS